MVSDQISELHQKEADAMETETMGRVLTEVTIENMEDLWAEKRGCALPARFDD